MKLLLIARPFVFHGGVERATVGLVQALVAHGYEVHLASPPGQAALVGVRLHRLPVPRRPATLKMLALALMARHLAGRRTWDIVQSHERTLGQHVYRAGEGCHRAYLESRDRPPARGLYHRMLLALERRVFERTPCIVAISQRGKQEIHGLYGVPAERVTVVYNGVDLERFQPGNRETLRGPARAEAGIPGDAWVVLFAGSGFERKGLGTAVDALALVDDPRARLIVVGKGEAGPYQARAARLGLAPRVSWLGARPDIERWYAAADVCVLPTRYEPFGNVHLEALASGLPVVTSPQAGGSELIRPGANGAIADPRDARAVAAALEEFHAASPTVALRVRETARASAEPFTYEAQVAGFGRLYPALLLDRHDRAKFVEKRGAWS
jgi:UDP-glucose:(heptosyl)LPS alpha-1,3-glucosyltransferase